jgi:CubicO group peptidase (beta-lactamase class C family)
MSGGLGFTAAWDPDFDPASGYPDHAFMYSGAIDTVKLALSRPARHAPGTHGLYLNADTLALQEIARRTVEVDGERLADWRQRTLFAPLGLTSMRFDCDPFGNEVLSGFVLGNARDWSALAQLWLDGGMAGGRRLLPEDFVGFCRTGAPGWSGRYWLGTPPHGFTGSIYGGHVWLNRFAPQDRWPLPEEAYFFLGVGGQYAWIIPSKALVIVRMGHMRGMLERATGREPLATAFGTIASAFPGELRP